MNTVAQQVDSRLTLLDGRALGWAEYGDPAGVPVVFLHGWPGSRYQGARLEVSGWVAGVRVIALERPGYGLSDMLPGWSMHAVVADVATLADVLGLERIGVFGASGGGPYALACGACLPDRVAAVAVASGVGRPGRSGREALLHGLIQARLPLRAALRVAARRAERDAAGLLDLGMRRLPRCDQAIVGQPEIRAIALRDLRSALGDGGRAATQDAQVLFGSWPFQPEDVRVPVRLWYGGMDPLVPPSAGRSLAAAIPQATFTYLPNEGHYLMIPRAVEILRWLAAGTH